MNTIETKIVINTPVSMVWNVLTDFEKMPEWNPFVTKIGGSKTIGAHLTMSLLESEGRQINVKPELIAYLPHEEIRWLLKYKFTGLFDSEHYLLLSSLDTSHTQLTHGERFSGILTPFFKKKIKPLPNCLNTFNVALQNRCELLAKTPVLEREKV